MLQTFQTNLDQEQLDVITTNMVREEKILWTGKMRGLAFFSRGFGHYLAAISQIIGSIFWITVSLAPDNGPGFIWALMGLPFGLVGFGLLLSPFYWSWAGNRSYGAVTDKRTVIVYQHIDREVFSFLHDGPIVPILRAEQELFSDILFQDAHKKNQAFDNEGGINMTAAFGFRYVGLMGIENGPEVLSLINDRRKALLSGAPGY